MEESTQQQNEVLPEGKIRTGSGNLIDRADAAFFLMEHKEHPNLRGAMDGVVYDRSKGGTLKRVTPKKSVLRKLEKLRQKQEKNKPQLEATDSKQQTEEQGNESDAVRNTEEVRKEV